MLKNFRCQIRDHGQSKIEEVCINLNCKQPSRRVCIKCLKDQLHNQDPNYQKEDIVDEQFLDKIISTFQLSFKEKLQEIELYYLMQQKIQIEEIQQRCQKLIETQQMIEQLRKQQETISQPSLQNYLENMHQENISIHQYLKQCQKQINQLDKQKNRQVSYLIKCDLGISQYVNQQEKFQENEQNIHIFNFINDLNKKMPEIDENIKQFSKLPLLNQNIDLHSQTRIILNYCFIQKDEELKKLMLQQISSIVNKKNIYAHNALMNQKFETQNYQFIEYLFAQGIKALDNKQFEEALILFDEILKINPNHKNTILNRGITLNSLSKFKDAIVNFNTVIQLDQFNINAYYNKGMSFMSLHSYKEALPIFNQILQIDKTDIVALIKQGQYNISKIGEIYYHLKYYQEALNIFNSILIQNSKLLNVINNKGVVLRSMKKYDEAMITFDKALVLNPRYISVINNKAITWLIQGKFQMAEILFKQSLEYEPNNRIASQGLQKLSENMPLNKSIRIVQSNNF
ncbi:hypothetical protein pb186bvf_002071 [Paramecium bursaria]